MKLKLPRLRWLVALVVVVLGATVYAGSVLATPPNGVTTVLYGPARLDPVNLLGTAPSVPWRVHLRSHGQSDVWIADNTIAPGGDTGWHSHPGPSVILVVSGTVTNYMGDDPSCTPHVYTAGQSFADPGGKDVHILRNEGSEPARTFAFQIIPPGAARRIDEPAPGNCPF